MDLKTSAVLFDIDGTLIDSTYHHAIAWHRAFARYGDPPPLSRIHRAIGMGGDKLVAHVAGPAVEDHLGDLLRAAWREEYLGLRAEVVALPGAADLVASVRSHGYHVALASSGDPQFSREAVDLLGIADHIDTLITSEDVDASKPDPDLVAATLHELPDIRHAVFIGDTVYDVEAARRAGIACIALTSGGYARDELFDAGAAQVAAVPEDLIRLDWDGISDAAQPPVMGDTGPRTRSTTEHPDHEDAEAPSEGGHPDEGTAGPNAPPRHNPPEPENRSST
jgi:HAD superfamily hydrolase (TIGR01549 family)